MRRDYRAFIVEHSQTVSRGTDSRAYMHARTRFFIRKNLAETSCCMSFFDVQNTYRIGLADRILTQRGRLVRRQTANLFNGVRFPALCPITEEGF